MFQGPTMKTKNIAQKKKSDAIENSSQNKTDKRFSWVGKNVFKNTILVFLWFISCKVDHCLLQSEGWFPSSLQKLLYFKINPFHLKQVYSLNKSQLKLEKCLYANK